MYKLLNFGKSRLRTTAWYKRCQYQDRLRTTVVVHVPLLSGFLDYNALSLPGEFFLDASPEKN